MEKVETTSEILFTIYMAGFNHGLFEGKSPFEISPYEAFSKLLKNEDYLKEGWHYNIKDKIKFINENRN